MKDPSPKEVTPKTAAHERLSQLNGFFCPTLRVLQSDGGVPSFSLSADVVAETSTPMPVHSLERVYTVTELGFLDTLDESSDGLCVFCVDSDGLCVDLC